MNETIEKLKQIQQILSTPGQMPDFEFDLDEADESLTFQFTDSKLKFVVKASTNVGSFIEDLVSTADTSRVFDDSNFNFQKTNEMNHIFLQVQERYFNHRLQALGHLFLNEIYAALGFEHSRSGSILGWIYKSEGMGYVDFGLDSDQNKAFVEGSKAEAILTFNVDGIIFDKI